MVFESLWLVLQSQTPNMADLLEWPKKDNCRMLHVVYRVGDLDRTIKLVFCDMSSCWLLRSLCYWVLTKFHHGSFRFYTECFGMKLLRQRDIPDEKYANAFLGFGPEESHFVVELTYSMLLCRSFPCSTCVPWCLIECIFWVHWYNFDVFPLSVG